MAGKARSTLQRHIKKGIISCEKADDGRVLVDVVELERVYGALQVPAGGAAPERTGALLHPATPPAAPDVVAVLQDQVSLLKQELAESKERERDLREMLKAEQQNVKLITAGPERRGFLRRLFGR